MQPDLMFSVMDPMREAASRVDPRFHKPGNRFEALKGDRKGQHSVWISDQWRSASCGPRRRTSLDAFDIWMYVLSR